MLLGTGQGGGGAVVGMKEPGQPALAPGGAATDTSFPLRAASVPERKLPAGTLGGVGIVGVSAGARVGGTNWAGIPGTEMWAPAP